MFEMKKKRFEKPETEIISIPDASIMTFPVSDELLGQNSLEE